ncbi:MULTISPECIES: hypothetical protein [unclassified Mesorhizobium]|uniref:hypothetical protein n=1 Tax=unclassified Mesorhizobium TaxID=325217 RepID=UPI00112CB63D|nr:MULTISPECIES: hypothetical protein [unclassified Mesorhizobium]TPL03743.1 hypothetical protein FJ567_05495 [Mesorhizobium sp. B2-4-16]TPL03758.1 hypothetical protein FJ567_05610 [Mesorhizobium sp. B2-4-16]TPL62324.1 hypothetical protein FJ956_25240 [Mesorhizobium sp. B2-4-3]
MIAAWHRTEPREVRPFFQLQSAEDSLRSCRIKLFKDSDISDETSFDLDEIAFQKLDPIVFFSVVGPETWLPSGLEASDLELVLVATHPFLKRSEVLASLPLSESLPTDWAISPEILGRFAGGRNLKLTVAICLRYDREPMPGSPFVVGHWLAQKTFSLKSRATPTLFDLRTRTDEEWVAAHFPPKTLYFVEYAGGIAEESEEDTYVARVYIHIDAHNKLVSSPSLGDAFQPFLATEIVLSILTESFSEWKSLDTPHSGSPLATLLQQLGKSSPITLSALKDAINTPGRARAILQDRLAVVQAIK